MNTNRAEKMFYVVYLTIIKLTVGYRERVSKLMNTAASPDEETSSVPFPNCWIVKLGTPEALVTNPPT